jgi:hypothetical protein
LRLFYPGGAVWDRALLGPPDLAANGLLTGALARGRTSRDGLPWRTDETAGQGTVSRTRRYWPRRPACVFKSPLGHRDTPGLTLGFVLVGWQKVGGSTPPLPITARPDL